MTDSTGRYLRRLSDQTYPQCPYEWGRTRLSRRDREAGCRLGERFRCMGPTGHSGYRHDANAENWTADGSYEPVRILDAMRSIPGA